MSDESGPRVVKILCDIDCLRLRTVYATTETENRPLVRMIEPVFGNQSPLDALSIQSHYPSGRIMRPLVEQGAISKRKSVSFPDRGRMRITN